MKPNHIWVQMEACYSPFPFGKGVGRIDIKIRPHVFEKDNLALLDSG